MPVPMIVWGDVLSLFDIFAVLFVIRSFLR